MSWKNWWLHLNEDKLKVIEVRNRNANITYRWYQNSAQMGHSTNSMRWNKKGKGHILPEAVISSTWNQIYACVMLDLFDKFFLPYWIMVAKLRVFSRDQT